MAPSSSARAAGRNGCSSAALDAASLTGKAKLHCSCRQGTSRCAVGHQHNVLQAACIADLLAERCTRYTTQRADAFASWGTHTMQRAIASTRTVHVRCPGVAGPSAAGMVEAAAARPAGCCPAACCVACCVACWATGLLTSGPPPLLSTVPLPALSATSGRQDAAVLPGNADREASSTGAPAALVLWRQSAACGLETLGVARLPKPRLTPLTYAATGDAACRAWLAHIPPLAAVSLTQEDGG